jgi:hypothetical protein
MAMRPTGAQGGCVAAQRAITDAIVSFAHASVGASNTTRKSCRNAA